MVSASEIASWAWCPESWRRERGLGEEPANQAALRRGGRFQGLTAVFERRSRAVLSLGISLLVLAMLLLAVLFLLGVRP
ncbi:hypothetical protein [Tautonia sociabilis]|uniref:Uncharacterized protein n=1 Tax=Tautonia sociabilis TaxID=2080755 RepID=A0A432MKS6_9BACT|nr:hypothetical protein [Tautonia sociabilis]RUL88012.1 hypothetical protein TsocGM_09835 [Tautonia sociabilis]